MNKEETLALWAQGKDAWNAWAQGMLDRRAEMEKAGTWAARQKAFSFECPGNEATRQWLAAAAADFAGRTFDGTVDFTGHLFPASADFSKARFNSHAFFEGATFKGRALDSARFDHATFSGNAQFTRTTFSGGARFSGVTFNSYAAFGDAKFGGDADFALAMFGDFAEFESALFKEVAWFGSATFRGEADFKHATFEGIATFTQTRFENYTSFAEATFRGSANFTAGRGESFFSLARARFSEVPDFIQVHFEEAPRLDEVRILPGKADADRAARYRALKRLAIQGHDHAREHEYFAGELKSLRGHPDRLLPNPLNWFRKDEDGRWGRAGRPSCLRYWFGLGYQCFSDFGRSMGRPFVWWGLALIGFAAFYLQQHCARATTPGCLVGDGDPLWAAIGLSIRKALPFAGVGSSEKLNQIYACLYGVHGAALKGSPVIPDAVDSLGIIQLLFSLLWLFLFLLAVRNHFRIK